MAIKKNVKVALIRGNSLNEWEGKSWEHLESDIEVTGFCAQKNLYALKNLSFPITQLTTSTDNTVTHLFSSYIQAQFQRMSSLKDALVSFTIAHTAEIYHYYTYQAVQAKQKNKNLKVVVTVWDNSFGRFEYNYTSRLKNPPRFWQHKINHVINEVVKGADYFLPVTNYSRALLTEYGVPDSKMEIITPAVVKEEREELNPEIIFKELEIPSTAEVYIMVNRLVKEKGVYDVLYAFKMYRRELKEVTNNKVLLIIGKGPEQENMQRLVKEWGLETQIKFVSYLSNDKVKQIYKKAKCLMLGSYATPLWQEQFGFVLAEAIINQCPVVAAGSGAIPEVVENAGILVQPSQPVDFCKALQQLDDKEIVKQLKQNCIRVKDKFEVNQFRKRLVEVYKKIL